MGMNKCFVKCSSYGRILSEGVLFNPWRTNKKNLSMESTSIAQNDLTTERSVEDITIPVPWGVIKGKWWGSRSTRPVLCLHGWQDNAGTFDPIINLLPSDLSYLCIDLPGHGLSSHLPQGVPYHLWWDSLLWVRRVVQYFMWDKVSIMGHSFGGYIGHMYAASYPDEIDLLIGIDSVLSIVFTTTNKSLADDIPRSINGTLRSDNPANKETTGTYEEMLDILFAGHKDKLSRSACEILLKRGVHSCGNNLYKFTRDFRVKSQLGGPPSPSSLEELSKKIKCRYLHIACSPGYAHIDTYKHVFNEIEKNSPHFQLVVVEADHHTHLTNPQKVSVIISEFLTISSNQESMPSS